MTQNNLAIQNVIIDVLIIHPIENIIDGLKKGEYADKDMAYLNDNLNKFSSLALDTLNIKIIMPDNAGVTVMNEYGINKYLGYFNILLTYFKKIK